MYKVTNIDPRFGAKVSTECSNYAEALEVQEQIIVQCIHQWYEEARENGTLCELRQNAVKAIIIEASDDPA